MQPQEPISTHEIIIIGAGAAGIAASLHLTKLAVPHVILQSRDVIGGRIRTKNLGECSMHLGAAFLQDSPENQFIKVMKELNILPGNTLKWKHSYFEQGENKINQSQIQQARKIQAALIQKIQVRSKGSQENCSVIQIIQEFFAKNKQYSEKQVHLVKNFFAFYALWEGLELQLLSVKASSFDNLKAISAPPGGYFSVLQQIYNYFKPKVIFNQKVVEIDYSSNVINLRTQDNTIYKAKYLLSSLPLGVLKKGIVRFMPPIPQTHQIAIKKITFGVLNKIFLRLEQDYFEQKKAEVIFFFNQKLEDYTFIRPALETAGNMICLQFAGFKTLPLFQKQDEQLIKYVVQLMQRYIKFNQSKITGYYITRWHKDENTFGSYSTLKPGESRQSIRMLSKSIQNRIWFMGQHCSPNNYGFVHGAFQTGLKAAKQLLQVIQSQKSTKQSNT